MAATDELGALGPLLQEYEQVEAQMADPQTLADPQLMRRVGRRYAELGRVKAAADRLSSASGDLEAARELAAEDRSFADEIPVLEEEEAAAHEALVKILAPRDPEDAMDVILEIKAGEGGEESALFASDHDCAAAASRSASSASCSEAITASSAPDRTASRL